MDEMLQKYSETAKRMNDVELAHWTASWQPGYSARTAGEMEIQRRRDEKQQERKKVIGRRAWISIAISIISLIVSVLAVLRK
jgi:hypothetical protein